MSQQPNVIYTRPPSNGLGTAGFVISLVGWLSCGLLCPIGLILSVLGMSRQPRGLALAGVILGGLGCIWGIIAFFFGGLALLLGCGGVVCGGIAPQVGTHIRMNMLADDVEKFQEKNGRMPTSVEEALSVRKRNRGEGRDAWGHTFRLEIGENGNFTITSDGPDGIQGTSDDVPFFHSEVEHQSGHDKRDN